MTVALVALFVALGSSATAAVVIRSSSQIKDGAIKRNDIAKNTLDSARIKDGTLKERDLKPSLQRDLGGAQTYEAFRKVGPENVPDGGTEMVAEYKQLPAGPYAIFAKTTIFAPTESVGLLGEGRSSAAFCQLDADGNVDDARALISAPGANAPHTLNMQITRTLARPTDIELRCSAEGETWRAADSSIIAIRISGGERQDATPPSR